MNKLTFIEKAYLRGLLEETMREHEKYLLIWSCRASQNLLIFFDQFTKRFRRKK